MLSKSLVSAFPHVLLIACLNCTFNPQATIFQFNKQPDQTVKLADQIDRLNSNVLKEDVGLSLQEKTSLYASLSRIWKDRDAKLSLKFLKTAVDQSLPALTDAPKDRSEKLRSLRKLLIMSALVDSKLTDDILTALKSEDLTANSNRQQNSIALTDAALATVRTNPSMAAALATTALNYIDRPSQNEKLYQCILALAVQDKKLGEDLFQRILKFAHAASDQQAIANLALFASPKSHTVEVDFLSAQSKRDVLDKFLQLLMVLSARFDQKQMPPEEREESCKLFLMGTGLRETFITNLPDRTQSIAQVLGPSAICNQATSSAATQSLFDVLSTQAKTLSVEELLKAARDSSDPVKRSFYFSVAIGRLSRDRKLEQVIDILDEMDDASRKAMGTGDLTFWTAMRVSNTVEAVLQKLETQDFGAANKIISKTPVECRPQVQVQVSHSVLRKVTSIDPSKPEHVFALDAINEARTKLSTVDPFVSVDLYLTLLNSSFSLVVDDAPGILKETIKAINTADMAKQELPTKDFAGGVDVISLSPAMLQHEDLLLSEMQQIDKRYTRIRFKLGLLRIAMQAYLKQQKPAQESTRTGIN